MDISETLQKLAFEQKGRERKALISAIDKLEAMKYGDDQDAAHSLAEDIICEYLVVIGAKQLADAFEEARDRVGFWYA